MKHYWTNIPRIFPDEIKKSLIVVPPYRKMLMQVYTITLYIHLLWEKNILLNLKVSNHCHQHTNKAGMRSHDMVSKIQKEFGIDLYCKTNLGRVQELNLERSQMVSTILHAVGIIDTRGGGASNQASSYQEGEGLMGMKVKLIRGLLLSQ